MNKEDFTNYEKTRILGARALQIAMDAPHLLDIPKKKLESFNYDPMEIAKLELEADVLPITVNQPMPGRKNVKIKKIKEEPVTQKVASVEESEEEKEISQGGEIMELANPEDEGTEETPTAGRESSQELQ